MQYPMKNWPNLGRGYTFMVPTFYSSHHLGLDVVAPEGTPLYAWQDLEVVKFSVGPEGGNTIQVKCPGNKRLFRLMHLQKSVAVRKYKEGEILCYIGKTGVVAGQRMAPHLHIDISKNGILNIKDLSNFEDPEAYFYAIMAANKNKPYNPMAQAKIVKEKVGAGVGIYIPAANEADLIAAAKIVGVQIPINKEGGIDWPKIKFSNTITLS